MKTRTWWVTTYGKFKKMKIKNKILPKVQFSTHIKTSILTWTKTQIYKELVLCQVEKIITPTQTKK